MSEDGGRAAMPSAIKRTSLQEQVTEGLIELIQERNLRAGDQLPGSAELAEMMSVSLPVVREAIAGLAAIGLLERHQGRETTVATPNASHLSRLFSLRVIGSEVDDEKLQQFREIVEVGNARLAARNRTPEELAALDEALATLNSARTAEELHMADVAFHAAVARAADNDLCELTLHSLEPLLRRLRRRVWNGWVNTGGEVTSIIDAHRTILTAIRDGDEDAAAAAMSSHLAQARVGLEEALGGGDHAVAPRAGFPEAGAESPAPATTG
ncbi:FadR/GntR family transcriptional regulator [Dactylosporangium sp. CA-092794]|uniref:FadR/GntR family transcriptional regulator n=1 Tax=Dactylosporangium sp. CA-092794 TaxID=3239929 RepID=UPI003D8A1B9D